MDNSFDAPKGLQYDKVRKYSDDFNIVAKWGGSKWNNEWSKVSNTYIYHKDSKSPLMELVYRIAKMTVNEFMHYVKENGQLKPVL